MTAGINILCYKSKTLANGEHPLMLRVCKDGKKKYISLGLSMAEQYWDFTKNKPKPNCPNKEYIETLIADKIKEYNEKIIEFKSENKEFTATTLIEKVAKEKNSRRVLFRTNRTTQSCQKNRICTISLSCLQFFNEV